MSQANRFLRVDAGQFCVLPHYERHARSPLQTKRPATILKLMRRELKSLIAYLCLVCVDVGDTPAILQKMHLSVRRQYWVQTR